jgi:hypothetical protein
MDAICQKRCPDGSYVAETAACPPPAKPCADGRYVPINATCMKRCPDGSEVPEAAACPQTCPAGSRRDSRSGQCVPAACEPYQVGIPPNCRCPPGMIGPRCEQRSRY